MERRIDHDKDGKLIKMLDEKSCGLKSVEFTYRTVNFDVRYVDDYSQDSYVEITPRYKEGLAKIARGLSSKFNKSDNPPSFFIDESYYDWEDVLKIQKTNHNKQIEKIKLYTYEQLQYFLSLDM